MKTYSPTRRHPWDARKAAHLLNRAGFGGPPAEVERLVEMGFEKAVDSLLNFEATPDNCSEPEWGVNPPEELAWPDRYGAKVRNLAGKERFDDGQRIQSLRNQIGQKLKEWWLDRMCRTNRPFQEKMTLFWHGHFVSSLADGMNSYWLYRQIDLYRRFATGNFKEMTLEVSRDPAMLRYLDNDRNIARRPNENYARELMELFTLGIGNYTEQDIKESARAFSGWTRRDTRFVFDAVNHDYGTKTFLGRTGNFDGTDIVDIIFEQPAVATFMARKLWKFYASQEPDKKLIEELAHVFRNANYEIKPLVRAIFTCDEFYSDRVIAAQVKGPLELAVGAIRALNIRETRLPVVLSYTRQMGQDLLAPPNVKGWDGGPLWINTTTLFVRYNFARFVVNEGAIDTPAGGKPRPVPAKIDSIIDRSRITTAEEAVDRICRALLPTQPLHPQRAELVDYLHTGPTGEKEPFNPAAPDAEARLRAVIYIIMSSPAYQVC
ncbi:MAG: DUF1800 domain-containing protein [Verrucomicrobiota bacterium]